MQAGDYSDASNAQMGIDEILGPKRDQILAIAAKHGVTSIRVFGSVARAEAGRRATWTF
jgi:predicted nucleotidyltransferase